jgi:hypothetical protein
MADHPTRVGFIDADTLPHQPGVQEPTVQQHQVPLLDDDANQCTTISAWGLSPVYLPYNPSYVDAIHTLVSYRVPDEWSIEGWQNEPLTVQLESGQHWQVPLHMVEAYAGAAATQYRKSNNIYFPADDSGTVLLNATNTPNLVWAKYFIYESVKRIHEQRLQIAEIVYSFSQAISALGREPTWGGRVEGLDIILKEMERH